MTPYTQRMRERYIQTGRGMAIPLSDGVFYSVGWRDCPHCEAPSDAPRLREFVEEKNGVYRRGWRCN